MCSVEHIPGPPHFLKSKVFFKKLIAFYLSYNKKGEVTSEKISSKGRNRNKYKNGFSVTSVLIDRLGSSSKGICLLSLYITLQSFNKIGQELSEINCIKTHRHTDRHTHRHLHADEIIPVQKQSFWAR